MEIMHTNGLVGPFKGSKSREVYYTLEEWEQANAKRITARKIRSKAPENDGDPAAAREGGAASDDEGS
jgi:hypothetical protein